MYGLAFISIMVIVFATFVHTEYKFASTCSLCILHFLANPCTQPVKIIGNKTISVEILQFVFNLLNGLSFG